MGVMETNINKYLASSDAGEMFFAPTKNVHAKEGFNPRKHYNTKKRETMRESIRDKGVHTPIIVRPHPTLQGEYEIAAGHTRHCLSLEVGREEIPLICKHLNDEEMEEIALIENTQREDMSPIDEGAAAKAILQRNGGDKDEVKSLLGWSASKLQSRIQLTYATDCVADALANNLIKLGHAELLSSLRETAQQGGLKLVQDQKLSVEQLRDRISKKSLEINLAIFDTKDCESCQHNTTPQASLFETGYEAGKCLNGECYGQKTKSALNTQKAELEESYHIIALSSDVANGTTKTLCPSGEQGVGQAQLASCSGCEKNGAIISEQLGSMGMVSKNICFDMSCHKGKVKDYQDAIQTSDEKAESTTKKVSSDQTSTTKKPTKKKVPTVAVTPKIIIEKNHYVHRQAAAHFVGSSSLYAKAMALIATIKDASLSGESLKSLGVPCSSAHGLHAEGRTALLNAFVKWEETALDELTQKVVCESIKTSKSSHGDPVKPETDVFGAAALAVINNTQIKLNDHFCMNTEYLKPHTKPSIGTLLKAAGFDNSYDNTNGEGAFDKLLKQKKDDLLKCVEKHEFDWTGFIPASMVL